MFFKLKGGIFFSNSIQPVSLLFLLVLVQQLATLQNALFPVLLPFVSVYRANTLLLLPSQQDLAAVSHLQRALQLHQVLVEADLELVLAQFPQQNAEILGDFFENGNGIIRGLLTVIFERKKVMFFGVGFGEFGWGEGWCVM